MEIIISVWFYLSIFALAASLIYVGEKYQKKWAVVIGIIIPILISAFRYKVGIDWDNYIQITNELSKLSLPGFLNSSAGVIYEHSMYYLTHLSRMLVLGDTLFFAIYAAIIIVPFYFGIKKIDSNKTWLAILLYLLMFFPASLNGMRQWAAISVVFCTTIYYIYDDRDYLRKNIHFIFGVLVATLIHSSAICALLIIPAKIVVQWLAKKDSGRIVAYHLMLTILAAVGILFVARNLSFIPFLSKYAHYLEWDLSEAPMPNLIPKIVPVVIGSMIMPRLIEKHQNSWRDIFYYMMTCVALAGSVLGFIVPYGYRISDYFLVFQIPLLISAVNSADTKSKKNVYILTLIAYALIFFLYSAVLNNSHGIIPYQFIS